MLTPFRSDALGHFNPYFKCALGIQYQHLLEPRRLPVRLLFWVHLYGALTFCLFVLGGNHKSGPIAQLYGQAAWIGGARLPLYPSTLAGHKYGNT